jgi:hypothetical protein
MVSSQGHASLILDINTASSASQLQTHLHSLPHNDTVEHVIECEVSLCAIHISVIQIKAFMWGARMSYYSILDHLLGSLYIYIIIFN